MIIKVNSGGGNLANYLLYGNKNSRDTSKITILDGNVKLTDKISKSLNCDDKHFHFIISANGKRTDEDMRAIFEDFKEELLHSYSKEEINLLAVLHQDTNNSHIHIQTPKINLLTNTKLDLYYHKRDMKRFDMIRDYLNLKHNEKPPSIPTESEPTKNWKYNPESIQSKKEKLEFENMFLDNIYDNRSKFSSHEELMKYIQEDLKLNVKKIGYDYKKDDFYITINHIDNKKSQRIFSPLFNDGKSKYITNKYGEKEYQKHDFNITQLEKQTVVKQKESLEVLRTKLDKMQAVEKARIDKRLGRMKPLAKERITSTKKDIEMPQLQTPPTPSPIKYQDLKKESSLENDAHQFKQLQELKQINLSEIAVKEYGFKFKERSEMTDIIEDTDTKKQLLIYKDEDGYKYINPYNRQERGDIANFLQKSATLGMNRAILDLINPLKAYLSIFKDLMKISELILKLTLDSFLEKNFKESNKLSSYKKPTRTRAPSIKGSDLKPC